MTDIEQFRLDTTGITNVAEIDQKPAADLRGEQYVIALQLAKDADNNARADAVRKAFLSSLQSRSEPRYALWSPDSMRALLALENYYGDDMAYAILMFDSEPALSQAGWDLLRRVNNKPNIDALLSSMVQKDRQAGDGDAFEQRVRRQLSGVASTIHTDFFNKQLDENIRLAYRRALDLFDGALSESTRRDIESFLATDNSSRSNAGKLGEPSKPDKFVSDGDVTQKWWFWLAIAVSAVLLIIIAVLIARAVQRRKEADRDDYRVSAQAVQTL